MSFFCYTLIFFTEYIPDIELNYQYAWITITVLWIDLGSNLSYVLYLLFFKIKLGLVKYYYILKFNYERLKWKIENKNQMVRIEA